jgi:hypothetical protein
MIKETWRPVVERDFEDLYEVCDLGLVRRTSTKRRLTPGVMPKGYRIVVLSGRGVRRTVTVHKLVLDAFDRPRRRGEEARHRDGDPSHNARSNLRWGTPSDNQFDKIAHGTVMNGAKNPAAVMTETLVRELIHRYANGGESQKALAAVYGIAQSQVSRIVTRKRWGHLS